MSFELEPQTGQHVQKMAPKKTAKRGAPKRALLEKKTVLRRSKRIADQQLEKRLKKLEEKMAKQQQKLEEKVEKQKDMVEEMMEMQQKEMEEKMEMQKKKIGKKMKEKFEEHAQDGSAHRVEERLEDLREDLEEHVEDGAAHQFEEQLDQLAEQYGEWEEKMEEYIPAMNAMRAFLAEYGLLE